MMATTVEQQWLLDFESLCSETTWEKHIIDVEVVGSANTGQGHAGQVKCMDKDLLLTFKMALDTKINPYVTSWDFKNYLWDSLPPTIGGIRIKEIPMSFYLATFRIQCIYTVTATQTRQTEQTVISFGGDFADFLSPALSVLQGRWKPYSRRNPIICDSRVELHRKVTKTFRVQRNTDIQVTYTKVIATVGLFHREDYDWPKFPTPFELLWNYGVGYPTKTVRELEMIRLSGSLRRKEFWFDKIKNSDTVSQWKQKATDQGFTHNQVSYVFEELEYYASLRDPITDVQMSDVDGVWHSDALIEKNLRQELLEGVTNLESVPEKYKDWQPGSDNQVLNLVNPSLYPICYGQTRESSKPFVRENALEYCNSGKILQLDNTPIKYLEKYRGSKKYVQKSSWLPSEFGVKKDGTVQITSYINNLHPVHHDSLYSTLEKIFAKFVPLFEYVLTGQAYDVGRTTSRIIPINWSDYKLVRPINTSEAVESSDSSTTDESSDSLTTDDDDPIEDIASEASIAHYSRPIPLPDAPEHFIQPDQHPASNKICLLGTKLQVIVKLANIVLAPGSHGYTGGAWDIDGFKDENIVATGIYYYDVSNISGSDLALQCAVRKPTYARRTEILVETIYGLRENGSLNQQLGSVLTPEGRCLAYPNTLQHRIQPFQLSDPSKAGHSKMLVFYLVNPATPITSSLTVPPQQLDWFSEELLKIPPFDTLPFEIVEHILTFLEWPLTLDKAKYIQDEFMNERKFFISKITERDSELPFLWC